MFMILFRKGKNLLVVEMENVPLDGHTELCYCECCGERMLILMLPAHNGRSAKSRVAAGGLGLRGGVRPGAGIGYEADADCAGTERPECGSRVRLRGNGPSVDLPGRLERQIGWRAGMHTSRVSEIKRRPSYLRPIWVVGML